MAVLTSPETYQADPDNAWRRLVGRLRKPREIAVLMEIAAWREREAQVRDVPRGRILKDDAVDRYRHLRARAASKRSVACGRFPTASSAPAPAAKSSKRSSAALPAIPPRSRCPSAPAAAATRRGGRTAEGPAQGRGRKGGRGAQDHRHRRGARGHRRQRRSRRALPARLAPQPVRRKGPRAQERRARAWCWSAAGWSSGR